MAVLEKHSLVCNCTKTSCDIALRSGQTNLNTIIEFWSWSDPFTCCFDYENLTWTRS